MWEQTSIAGRSRIKKHLVKKFKKKQDALQKTPDDILMIPISSSSLLPCGRNDALDD
jgi:hypothetical protein